MIIYPPIDPKIRKCLNELYKKSNNKKKDITEEKIFDKDLRRCNICKLYYPVNETNRVRYYAHSKRKYRLCIECEKKRIKKLEE